MKVVEGRAVLPPEIKGTSLALGYFDGVHLGHQAVLARAKEYAHAQGLAAAAFTFSRGDKPTLTGGLLQTAQQKLAALAQQGLDYCFAPPFADFCNKTPQAFFEQMLLGEYRAKALFCGENFVFGAQRAGTVEVLRALCEAHGVHLEVVPTAMYEGEAISSSRIRAALAAGDIPAVNAMLGRPYEIAFPVVHGQRLGSSLGFPTINQLFPQGMQPPAPGVYVTKTVIAGKAWASATGYGNRPTVDGKGETCETFIPGFEGDLYDLQPQVQFYEKIADVQKFASVEQLAAAVKGWAAQAAEYFA